MKKAGIMTIHWYHNFGSVLQAYATQRIFEICGYNAEIIDYRPDVEERGCVGGYKLYEASEKMSVQRRIFKAVFRRQIEGRYERFERFIEEKLNLSQASYNSIAGLKTNPPLYDIYVSGSDQLWNTMPETRKVYTEAYYLSFVHNVFKMAFATSLGSNDNFIYNYKALIEEYKALMIREKSGVEFLKDMLKRNDIYEVLDPTLLIDSREWRRIAHKRYKGPKYIFVYQLGDKERNNIFPLADFLADKYKCKVMFWCDSEPRIKKKWTNCINMDPGDFLNVLNNAEFVLTNSYHGVLFSVNFGKQFLAFKNSNAKDTRVLNVLKRMGIENRIASDVDTAAKISDSRIDYKAVNVRLEEERKRCRELLMSSLQENKR